MKTLLLSILIVLPVRAHQPAPKTVTLSKATLQVKSKGVGPNPDDIDFQIEADFSGLMAPGMPNTAVQIGDSIGHIMNYGDGWYGGAYVGAMYSLAFLPAGQTGVTNDVGYVVTEALKILR